MSRPIVTTQPEGLVSHMNVLTTPVIYSLGLPLVLLDFWITLYQWTCFPIYGVPIASHRDYIVFDRHRLPYLRWGDRINCGYCTYANGVLAYAREIAARTEQYWCPIKHSRPVADPHEHYQLFLDYGDADGYQREWPRLRSRLAAGRPRLSASPSDAARRPAA